jgi:predicted nucleic acid-binding protein
VSLFFLDTNVLTEGWKLKPEPTVERWIEDSEWLLPVPVIAEIQEGAEADPSPVRRARINGRLDAFLKEHGILIVAWDAETSRVWGRLAHSDQVNQKPAALWDSLIDAMAVRHGAIVATRNTADFRHAKTFNQWTVSQDPPVQRAS